MSGDATFFTFGFSSLSSLIGRKAEETQREVAIDDILTWVYRFEMPKAASAQLPSVAGGGGSCIASYAKYGVRIDGGGTPDYQLAAPDAPDLRALVVNEALSTFDGLPLDLRFDGLALLPDMLALGLTELEAASAIKAGRVAAVTGDGMPRKRRSYAVRMVALFGRCERPGPVADLKRSVRTRGGKPAWYRETVRICESSGESITVEADGYDYRRRRPFPGAYRKTDIAPDPARIVADRLAYLAIVETLGHLRRAIEPLFPHLSIGPTRLPLRPWAVYESASVDGARRFSEKAAPRSA